MDGYKKVNLKDVTESLAYKYFFPLTTYKPNNQKSATVQFSSSNMLATRQFYGRQVSDPRELLLGTTPSETNKEMGPV